MKCLFVDYETKCKLDIEKVGLDNYCRAANILMLGWAVDDDDIEIWFPHEEMPSKLLGALSDPQILKIAWNVPFERNISHYQLKIDIPIEQWRDVMVMARYLSLPGKLDAVCDILKISEDKAKIKDGKRLIDLFCVPNGREGEETLFGVSDGFENPKEHPEDWKKFQDYCRRDVEVERDLWKLFNSICESSMSKQWKDWFMDQQMNDEGIPINVTRAKKALSLAQRYKKEAKKKLNEMTGLENANSREQLLPWLKARKYPWGSLLKTYVDNELKNSQSELTTEAKDVLTLRQKSSQNSYKKLESLLNQVSPDGRLRNQFSFMGASRTGRWSSAGVQVQNLPRPIKQFKKTDPAHIFDLIDREAYDEVLKEFDGSTLPFVSSSIRMIIEAPAKQDMVVCDLSSIEYGVVGWLARCNAIMNCLREKRDPYLDFAPHLYPDKHYTYEWLKKQYDLKNPDIEAIRQMAKPPVLGGGFGLGGGDLIVNEFGDTVRSGMWGYALNVCGVDMSKDLAHTAIEIYRKVNHEVVQLWTDLEQAFKHTLKYGEPVTVGHATFNKKTREWGLVTDNFTNAYIRFSRIDTESMGSIICMHLPSGRILHYLNCRIEEEEFTYTDKKTGKKKKAMGEVIYYDGIEHSATTDEDGSVSKKAHKWGKTKNYGGKICENAVQAIARDVLISGCHLAKEAGLRIFGVFHDEIATLTPRDFDAPTLGDLHDAMSTSPLWAPTMILGAEGWTGKFYRKG